MAAKTKYKLDQARKRNFGKYCLSSMASTLRKFHTKPDYYSSPPLLEEEKLLCFLFLKI